MSLNWFRNVFEGEQLGVSSHSQIISIISIMVKSLSHDQISIRFMLSPPSQINSNQIK